MKVFFEDVRPQMRIIREKGSKKSGLSPADRSNVLATGLKVVGNHINGNAPAKDEDFIKQSW